MENRLHTVQERDLSGFESRGGSISGIVVDGGNADFLTSSGG